MVEPLGSLRQYSDSLQRQRERFGLSTILETYDEVIATLDGTVAELMADYASHLSCHMGCASCCIDGFRIRYIEALSVLKGFCELPPAMAETVLQRLNTTTEGVASEAPVLQRMQPLENQGQAKQPEVRQDKPPAIRPCPLLNEEGACSIYEHRPALCRAFGLILKASQTLGCCSLNFQNIEDLSGMKALDVGPYYEILDDLSLKLWQAQPLNDNAEPPRLSIRQYLRLLLQGPDA